MFGRINMEPRTAYAVLKEIAKDAVDHGVQLIIAKNKNEHTVSCPSCNYRFKYRINQQNLVYTISKTPHSCPAARSEVPPVFFPYVREAVLHMEASSSGVSAKQIRRFISDELGVKIDEISMQQVYSGMRSVRNSRSGKDSIIYLKDFAGKFNESNPGRIELIMNESSELSSIYLEFNYSRQFANLNDRLYFLDGTHRGGVESWDANHLIKI